MRLCLCLCLGAIVFASPAMATKRALFDNAHAETAGNADWEIDTHQPIPSPDQSGIGPNTPGTYWVGAISSWGVDLVKRGYTVATNTSALTYGNTGNPYDLSSYDVLIIDEPNTLFSPAEATAILNFVRDGGGLIAVSDHSGSDRNNDGSDSPVIWNALDPTHVLGVHFGVSGDANNNIVQTSTNVAPASSDSVTYGPIGVVTGFAFHNGTTMTLYPSVNPQVRGEVWMTGASQTSLSGLMAASSVYGSGRVVFAGDSSPADDGSAAPGNSSIFDGWGEAGATDSTLFLNATLWATRRPGDTTPPVVSLSSPGGGEDWKAGSSHPIIWTASDDVAVSAVDLVWSSDAGATFPNVIASGLANSGSYLWVVPNAPSTTARVRVTAHDAAGHAASAASGANFTIDDWLISASAGTGGSITPSGNLAEPEGATQGFTITPDADYQITDVLVDGSSVGAASSYTFTGIAADHSIGASFIGVVDVGSNGRAVLALNPPLPNPTRAAMIITFSLPAAGRATLEIIDLAGRRVWQEQGEFSAGPHSYRCGEGRSRGIAPGAGLYFVRLITPWGTRTQRCVMLE